ncbi:MAG: TapB family protein [Streptosporangiaceae bacterium]
MTRYHLTSDGGLARRAVTMAALLAVSGLALAGCKGSSSASGPSGSTSSAGTTPSASSSSGSQGSGSGGSSGGSSGGASGTSLAADFPLAVGNTWVYETKVGALSHGTTINKVVRLVPVAGGQRVRMRVIDHLGGGTVTPTSFAYIFHNDGSITIPFSEFSSEKVRLISGGIVWPSRAQIASGQPLHSTLVFATSIVGHTLRVTAHVVVRGAGTQSVTVPVGTYRAQVVEETMTEKVEGIRVTTTVKTWVAPGVGPVKDEVLSSSAIPSTVEVLKSFTRG